MPGDEITQPPMVATLGVFREKRLNYKRDARQGKLMDELLAWGRVG